ncbi:MAG: hypothetical protein KC442_10455, partial [Thermomicrobiales bacterium]|nr:hypothetical protein [Thermomicrobiales bacterium]
MNQHTFDTFVRRTATPLNRRSLWRGASAALLTIAGLPVAATAKTTHELEQPEETIVPIATLPMTRRAIAAATDPIAELRG